MADIDWKSKGILFLPYRPELMTLAPSTFNLALDNFHVVGPYFSAAILADEYTSKHPCFSFWEFYHF